MIQEVDADEGKMGDRRLSVSAVLGLDAPAETPNLRTAQSMCAAEAAATTPDTYNAGEHVDDDNTIVDISDQNIDRSRH